MNKDPLESEINFYDILNNLGHDESPLIICTKNNDKKNKPLATDQSQDGNSPKPPLYTVEYAMDSPLNKDFVPEKIIDRNHIIRASTFKNKLNLIKINALHS